MNSFHTIRGLVAGSVCVAAFALFAPSVFAASAVSVNQILPPNAQTCPALGVSEVVPYVYDSALHSFDITLTDASYVGIGGTVNGAAVPFNQMTRWLNTDGTMRIHVDLPVTPLGDGANVSLSLISPHASNTAVTCAATVTATIAPTAPVTQPASPVAPTEGNDVPVYTAPAYTPHTTENPTLAYPTIRPASIHIPTIKPPKPATSTGVHFPGLASLVTANTAAGAACASPTGSARLWVVLIVLYAIFSAILYFQEGIPSPRTREWYVVAILAILAGLLLFWYLSAACRTGGWAPIAALIVAGISVLALLWKHPAAPQILLLEDK